MDLLSTTPRSVDLDIDAEGAYAFLTDLDFLPQWYPGMAGVLETPSGEVESGDHFVERRHLGPGVNLEIELEVTAAEEPRRFRVVNTNRRVMAIEAEYRIVELGPGRTRVTLVHDVRPARTPFAPLGVAVNAMLARADRRQLEAMPAGLARWRAMH